MPVSRTIRCSTIAPLRSFCSEDILDARTDFRFGVVGARDRFRHGTGAPRPRAQWEPAAADQGHRLEGPGGFRRKCLKLRSWTLQLARTERARYSAMA